MWRVIEAAASMLESFDKVSMLLLGGLELVVMSGVFTELNFYMVDLLLAWCKLVWLVGSGRGCAGCLSAAHSHPAPFHK